MTVCKHCGTEIEDGLEYCPNCGQSTEELFGDFFEPDEGLEEEAYNIFDTPEEFDMDSLLEREFDQQIPQKKVSVPETPVEMAVEPESYFAEEIQELFTEENQEPVFSDVEELSGMDFFESVEPEDIMQMPTEEPEEIEDLFGLFDTENTEESLPVPEVAELSEPATEAPDGMEFEVAEETDFFALDDLFQGLEAEPEEFHPEETEPVDQGLEELLAAGTVEPEETEGKKKKAKKEKKERKSLFKTVFGNVPVDPSKIEKEPTPEEIAAKKQKKAAEKKAKQEEKKLAAEEKKQIAQQNKEEKARQKALAKEEKKTKKLQEAKQILEEMQDTRINRVGATIVIVLFVICAIALLSGSEIFGYTISIHSAENNFNKAYNNNVKYYTDAYNDIYGLKIKPEDQVLNEKIMTVMFVNKELNSYNSQMILEDYQAALHSLLLGLYRYGKYYEKAIPLGIDRDMDYVRTQILKELESTFKVSEDKAEVLRAMLANAGTGGIGENSVINADAAREYNLALYEIVEESGLNDDSNN